MLKFGNKEFRNLQEQVLKNMRDIQNIMQGTTVLAEFGIKVIGQVDTAMELPDPATYEGEYGDAYVVGTEEPYEYYIFTRAFEGQDEPSWFDLGIFPVPGPQGEQGPQGPVGPQGPTGPTGSDGTSAGFGTVSATATTLPAGSDATVSVIASGPNTEKSFAFTFGIPEGEQGAGAEPEWGDITGDLSDQTDLVSALQAKQNSLVSGTNIKTINNESILGSGDLTITAGVSDVEVNGVSVVDEDGVAAITVPTNYVTTDTAQTISGNKTLTGSTSFGGGGAISISGTGINVYTPATIRTYGADLNLGGPLVLGSSKIKSASNDSYGLAIPSTTSFTADKTIATTDQIPSLTGYATETWVTNQGYITGINSNDVISALGYTPGTSNFSGSYTDLTDKPTIPTDTSDLTNNAGFITSAALSGYATETWVGNQGYLTSVSWNDVSGKPTFATVATSGDYDDLLNKPSIPAAQVNSDWNAASGVAQILNKPSLATVATSGSYADLTNKPTIPSVSGTYTGSNWDTITIDGTTKNVGGGSVTDVEVDNVSVVTSGVAELTTETWTFTLSDNTTVTKKVLVG